MLREGGIEGLLQRDKPGPRAGDFKLLKGKPRIKKLRDALLPSLKRFWGDAEAVLNLVGRPWLRDQANISYPD